MEPARKGDEAAGLRKVQADRGTDDNVEDCPVCLTALDDTIQRPRTLPCGHIFCTPCLNELDKQGQVLCPTCRSSFAVPEAGQFPVSYITESFIRRLRVAPSAFPSPKPEKYTAEPAASQVTGPGEKETEGLSKKIQSLVQEEEAKVLAAISTCQEVHAELEQYQTTLDGWGDQQQQLSDKLQALVDENNSARVLVQQGKSQVMCKKQQVQQIEQLLQITLQTLRSATTGQDAYKAIDHSDHRTEEENDKAEECRKMFPDENIVTTIRRVTAVSTAAVKAAQTMEGVIGGAAGHPTLTVIPTSTITERLQALLATTLEAEDLRTLTQPTRNLLQAGLVFAAHKTEGQNRHARISLENGRLYLHFLQDKPLVPGAVTVQMDELVPVAPPCLVFLDLAWPGSATRRILVRLNPDTPLGRQFILMCTGQRGPCYANSRLLGMGNKGQKGEWVLGGDYEGKYGKGGAAVLPDLNKCEYQKLNRAGAVFRVWRGDESDWNAMFGIYTRDKKDDFAMPDVFGRVVGGLDGLAAAVQYVPITEVTVVDCGVVLWAYCTTTNTTTTACLAVPNIERI